MNLPQVIVLDLADHRRPNGARFLRVHRDRRRAARSCGSRQADLSSSAAVKYRRHHTCTAHWRTVGKGNRMDFHREVLHLLEMPLRLLIRVKTRVAKA